jgi:hypothetical protein
LCLENKNKNITPKSKDRRQPGNYECKVREGTAEVELFEPIRKRHNPIGKS